MEIVMAGLACSTFTGFNKQYFQCLAMTGIEGKQWLTVEAVTKKAGKRTA
jgi:hypothetical protein